MAGDSDMDDVAAARIEGKLDVMNERLVRFSDDMADARARLNGHSERLSVIERRDSEQVGEKRAINAVVKALWALIGVLLTGGVATVLTVYYAIT